MSKGPNSKRFSERLNDGKAESLTAKDIETAMRKPLTASDIKASQVYLDRVVISDNVPKITAAFKKYSFGTKKPSFTFKLGTSEQPIVVTKDNVSEIQVMFMALTDMVRNG